jgi:hypothetical protein
VPEGLILSYFNGSNIKLKTMKCFFTAGFYNCKNSQLSYLTTGGHKLYPLANGNTWIYIDSFFDDRGFFYGLDTFTLKVAKSINFNNHLYTPITDQYDDSIFTVRSTDTTVFMLKYPAEPLLFLWPHNAAPTLIVNSYRNDTLIAAIFTQLITTIQHPSYKILVTYDDGQRSHYKQQELYFTPGIGITRGRDIRKNSAGILYAYDSYRLISYSLY